MTVYHSIVIGKRGLSVHTTTDAEEAEGFEFDMRRDPMIGIQSYGNINGDCYVVVYYKESMRQTGTRADDNRLGVRVKVCCDAMGDAMMMNDIRQGIIQEGDDMFIWWSDGDAMPLRYCPNCGKKIEVVR